MGLSSPCKHRSRNCSWHKRLSCDLVPIWYMSVFIPIPPVQPKFLEETMCPYSVNLQVYIVIQQHKQQNEHSPKTGLSIHCWVVGCLNKYFPWHYFTRILQNSQSPTVRFSVIQLKQTVHNILTSNSLENVSPCCYIISGHVISWERKRMGLSKTSAMQANRITLPENAMHLQTILSSHFSLILVNWKFWPLVSVKLWLEICPRGRLEV